MGKLKTLRNAIREFRMAHELTYMKDMWELMERGDSRRLFMDVFLTTNINDCDETSRESSNNDVFDLDNEPIII